jgi:CRP-like cAMP-binding protein
MSESQLLEALRKLHFLKDVQEEQLKQLAEIARLEDYPENTVLFKEGGAMTRTYFVAAGKVALEIQGSGSKAQRIYTVGEGELLGWSPILTQQATTATARTLTAAKVVSLHASQVLELCQQDTSFGFLFMHRTAEALVARLNAVRLLLLDVVEDELPVIADEPGAGD